MQSAIGAFAAENGGLDLALNAAGVAVAAPFAATPPADWDWIVAINLMGVVHCCRAELPLMTAAGGGLVINVASAAAFASTADASAYNATKAAVVSLSETLQQECGAAGVQVSVAMPGFFRTRLMEHARASPEMQTLARKMMQRSELEAGQVAAEILARAAAGATHIVLPARYRWLWRLKRLAPRRFGRWMVALRARKPARAGAAAGPDR